jgi:hypothetical protein
LIFFARKRIRPCLSRVRTNADRQAALPARFPRRRCGFIATGGKKLLSEELAERARAALTPKPPAHLSAGEAERRRRTRSRASAAERRRYMVHGGKAEEQAAALESRYPWTGAMSLALGFSVALFGGSLAPAGLAVARGAGWNHGLIRDSVLCRAGASGKRAGIAQAALFCGFTWGGFQWLWSGRVFFASA